MSTVILRTTTRLVAPLIVVVSISLFLQGHQLPGGGFVGGVLTATGFALVYVTNGLDHLERVFLGEVAETGGDPFRDRVVLAYRHLLLVGVGLVLATAVVPLALGANVLAQDYVILHDVPLYGELEVASALAFDFGVYLVVVGGLLTVLAVVGSE